MARQVNDPASKIAELQAQIQRMQLLQAQQEFQNHPIMREALESHNAVTKEVRELVKGIESSVPSINLFARILAHRLWENALQAEAECANVGKAYYNALQPKFSALTGKLCEMIRSKKSEEEVRAYFNQEYAQILDSLSEERNAYEQAKVAMNAAYSARKEFGENKGTFSRPKGRKSENDDSEPIWNSLINSDNPIEELLGNGNNPEKTMESGS